MVTAQAQPRAITREHGLDALRGVLMLLGVALHSVGSYKPNPGNTWFHDPFAFSYWADFVLGSIHTFRMPAFFVLSGFFGALLWNRRGARAMLTNRFKRIVVPFVLFALLLWPCIVYTSTYGQQVITGAQDAVGPALERILEVGFIPPETVHLWFLYHLIWISLFVTGVVTVMERRSMAWPNALRRLRAICESPWRSLVWLGLLNLAIWSALGWRSLPTSTAWIPDPVILSYYVGCYGLGWALFAAEFDLPSLTKRCLTLVSIGFLATVIGFLSMDPTSGLPDVVPRVMGCVALVTLTRGLSGLFIRFASAPSGVWRYVSDSSYWVYLVHLPLCILVPSLIVTWDLPVLPKWLSAMTLVALFSFATYDLMVRSTAIGRLLNGRAYERYSLKLSLTLSLVLLGGMTHVMANYSPLANLPSPWKGGATIEELLPNEAVDFPVIESVTTAHGCVGLGAYVICPYPSPFNEANAKCEELEGGALALPDDAEEQERLMAFLKRVTSHTIWIGATDQDAEGEWHNLAGEPLTYGNWNTGEPNDYGSGEDCAVYRSSDGKWNDRACRARMHFVCERSPPR